MHSCIACSTSGSLGLLRENRQLSRHRVFTVLSGRQPRESCPTLLCGATRGARLCSKKETGAKTAPQLLLTCSWSISSTLRRWLLRSGTVFQVIPSMTVHQRTKTWLMQAYLCLHDGLGLRVLDSLRAGYGRSSSTLGQCRFSDRRMSLIKFVSALMISFGDRKPPLVVLLLRQSHARPLVALYL